MQKTIIFDVDGVICDTAKHHLAAWKKLFAEEKIKFTHRDYEDKVNGLPRVEGVLNIMGRNLNKEKLNFLMAKKQDLYLKSIKKNPPKVFGGLLKFIKELKKAGYKVAAASSSKNSEYILKLLKIYNIFDTVITGHDFKKSKPDPDIFLTAAKKVKAKSCDCVVFEDAVNGILAAKNAKMKAVGVAIIGKKKELMAADLIISDYKGINCEILNDEVYCK